MSDYPYLSLNHITIDPALARMLPRRLAYYYLAFPLARDDEQTTLVMAHPENQAALTVLAAALNTRIVPVQGAIEEIRVALHAIWSGEASPKSARILCWGTTPDRAARAGTAAAVFARARSAQVVSLHTGKQDLDTVLSIARDEHYSLTVIDEPDADVVAHVLRQSFTPVLLVRGKGFSLRHILLLLRGHSPDEHVLDWAVPLALLEQASVTLFTVAPLVAKHGARVPHGLANLLSEDSEPGQHVMACARRLTAAGIAGHLKLCQGTSAHAIAGEVAQQPYDLITLAAEAHGDFVQRVLHQLDALPAHSQPSILVIKPIAD